MNQTQNDPTAPSSSGMTANQWAMLLHFSQYAGFIVPVGGFLVPILIWQLKKDDVPGLDEHGKNVTNWLISSVIYAVVSSLLTIILIGILGLIAVALMALIFPIIGGIKANAGETWKYPAAIGFLK